MSSTAGHFPEVAIFLESFGIMSDNFATNRTVIVSSLTKIIPRLEFEMLSSLISCLTLIKKSPQLAGVIVDRFNALSSIGAGIFEACYYSSWCALFASLVDDGKSLKLLPLFNWICERLSTNLKDLIQPALLPIITAITSFNSEAVLILRSNHLIRALFDHIFVDGENIDLLPGILVDREMAIAFAEEGFLEQLGAHFRKSPDKRRLGLYWDCWKLLSCHLQDDIQLIYVLLYHGGFLEKVKLVDENWIVFISILAKPLILHSEFFPTQLTTIVRMATEFLCQKNSESRQGALMLLAHILMDCTTEHQIVCFKNVFAEKCRRCRGVVLEQHLSEDSSSAIGANLTAYLSELNQGYETLDLSTLRI